MGSHFNVFIKQSVAFTGRYVIRNLSQLRLDGISDITRTYLCVYLVQIRRIKKMSIY